MRRARPEGDAGSAAHRAPAVRPLPLDQLLHRQGFGTRRACRVLVWEGRVTVNGVPAEDPDAPVSPEGTPFAVDGEAWIARTAVYLVMHKPAGHEVSRKPQHHPSVLSLLPAPLVERGVQPVGRLDVDTTGLLLFSDDGAFVHALTSPRHAVRKTYEVVLELPAGPRLVPALRQGVQLHDEPGPVAAEHAELLAPDRLRLVLTEGRYHQVKRMVAAAGNHVAGLHRPGVGELTLDGLAPGAWRWLTESEVAALRG